MELNYQSARKFEKRIYHFLNNILPGIVVLDLIFKRGFFSQCPQTLIEFLLYIVWAFLLSIPFSFLRPFSVSAMSEQFKKEAREKLKFNDEQMKLVEEEIKRKKKFIKKSDELFHFLFILIYCVLTIFIAKYLVSHYIYYKVWHFNIVTLLYFNTMLIFLPVNLVLYLIVKSLGKKYIRNSMQSHSS